MTGPAPSVRPLRAVAPAHSQGAAHLRALAEPIGVLEAELTRIERWGAELARRLLAGARLLACGNGGSAAEAQHLTAELVGRFEHERQPLSALALHAESSSLTAIANDYGYEQALARQVRAHGRRGDVLIALSCSGASANVVAAAEAARGIGLICWALTGSAPNPLALLADEALTLPGTTATVQEAHLIAVHLLCGAVDRAVAARAQAGGGEFDGRARRLAGSAARRITDPVGTR
jgi:D-sedoheptulose 7-phosphate isomerase